MNHERIWPTKENMFSYLKGYPEHKQRYDLVCTLINDLDCADISSGAGYGSYIMGETARTVKGFDVSQKALDYANIHFIRDNVSFHHMNQLKGNKFDFISSIETIEHMKESDGDVLLRDIAGSLKSDGTLIISTPLNVTQYKHNVTEFHIREYDNDEFKMKLAKNGFCVEKWYGQSNLVSERLSEEVMGVSILKIIKTGLHRLFPKPIRRLLSIYLLKKNNNLLNESCRIKENDLKSAFCQIAICRLTL